MAIYSPVGTPATPLSTPEEDSILPAFDLSPPKQINPQARELLQAERVAEDPLAKYQKVEPAFLDAGGAKLIDLNARAKLGGFGEEKPTEPAPLPGYKKADTFDLSTVDELDADRTNFNPVTYLDENPDVAEDPKRLSKLLAVYRKRREEGLVASEVVKSAVKETPGLVANIAGGVKRFGERAVELTVQPVANVAGSVVTGDIFDDRKREAFFNEADKNIKKAAAEVSAGTESAAVGLVDLSRQGLRKLDDAGKSVQASLRGEGPVKRTDQELLREISDDVAFRQNAAEILTGQGEVAKGLGLDKETLAKQGIELDEKAIEQLSLVDPITMVATGGAFKLVGIGGKVLATAETLAGAKWAAGKLGDLAKYSAGKAIQGAGMAAAITGKKLAGTGRTAALITGLGAATQGAGTVEALAIAAATKAVGPAIRDIGKRAEHFGKAIAGEVPISSTAQKVIDYAKIPGRVGKEISRGAFTGIAAAAPFAVMADEDATAGALFGAGAALGAGGGTAGQAFRVVKRGASRRYFGENRPILEDIASPGYGKDAALDATHEANISKLSAQDAAEVNHFREGLRQQGGEIYSLDRVSWRKEMQRVFPDITPEQLDIYENHSAFFDEAKGPDRQVVYLNADATGLRHDAGHIFDAILSPEKRAELRTAVADTFGQKAIDDFKEVYQRRVGNKISDKAALDEFIAEQFNALFYNVPLAELNAPKSLLTKFVDTLAEGAEALGIDLSAGATTPALGAPVSVGIRKLFQSAAGDVIRANIEGVPPTNIVPFPGGPTPPSADPGPGPGPAPAPVPPSNIVPLPVGRNIRVTPEQTAAFKQQTQTPEARAAAAARAAETGVDYARAEAKKADGSPTSLIIEQISDTMESGRPVVAIEHLGITSASTPAASAPRTPRRGEQAAGYAALEAAQLDVRQNAPPEVVTQHSKNFVPVRWTDQGGTPTLIAMSLDKVISNILKIAADPKAADLIPYEVVNGKLTEAGWREVVADAQSYSENQANGRKGDGGRLTVPEAGLSIPAENPTYTPKPLTPERANFQNLVQGIAPPQTSRAQTGVMPGNVKGQLLAEANQRAVEIPANIPTKQAGKQAFIEFPPRVVQEVNPLRNAMESRGVKTRELLEVTERIRAKDIVSATPRPEVAYQAPVTDIIRGGFLPAPTEFRQKNLGGRTVEEFSDYILKSSPTEWKAATDNMTGGLTGGAWNLGLGLKNAADVGVLKSYADKFSDSAKAAMKAGDFDLAFSNVTRGQFFREAYEAATGTGSAGAAFKRGTAGMESAKPPFPITEKTQASATGAGDTTTVNIGEGGQFLPAEELAPVAAEPPTPEIRVASVARPQRPLPPGARPPIIPPPVAAREEGEQPANFLPAPDKKIQDLAKSYADDAGLPYAPKGGYAEVKPDLAKRLADFYDKAVSDPTNPEVVASYEALIRETEEQGKAILADGYKIEPWTGAGEPYKNSAEAVADVRNNKHLFFRKTEGAFGSGESSVGNPMLRESTLVPGQVANDVFRWVHDFFGHSKEGFQFGPRGEFNAWRSHSEMYSPAAQGALAGETLAQNSWVNYGPHLEGKNIPLAERPFAEQKNVVVPRELIDEATFLPKTESGRKLEERGYEIVSSGELGMRRVSIITPSGAEIASIQSVQRSPKTAEIAMVQKSKGAPKGLGEVLYREVGAQLKEDGVTKVTGQVVSPEPLAIRRKIFGDFESIDINGEPATFEQALSTSERLKSGFENEMASIEPVSRITAETRFLPGEQQDMNFVRQGDAAAKVSDLERQRTRLISEMKSARAEDLPAMAERLATVSRDAELAWRDHTRSRAGFLPKQEKIAPEDLQRFKNMFITDMGDKTIMQIPEGIAQDFVSNLTTADFPQHEGKNSHKTEVQVIKPNGKSKSTTFYGVGDDLIRDVKGLVGVKSTTPKTKQEFFSAEPPEKVNSDATIATLDRKPIPGRELTGSGWLFRDGKAAEVESGTYHDDTVNGLADAGKVDARSPEEFQTQTGAVRLGTTDSARHISDYGNADLGISLSRKLSGPQRTEIVELLKNRTPDDEPYFNRISVDITAEDGTIYAGRSFRYPEQRGAIARFLTDPFSTEFEAGQKSEGGFLPGPRDAQGRPLDKKGEIDYVKWQKESVSANRKRTAEPIEAAPEPTGPITSDAEVATGWILPNRKFVSLGDSSFHEQYLADKADELNKKFGTEFNPEGSDGPAIRLEALNAGFVRMRNYSGQMTVEANASKWPSLKSKVQSTLQDLEGKIDNLTVSLLNNEGQQVDSHSVRRMHEMSVPEKMNAIEEAVSGVRPSGPRFLPGEGLPGFEDVSPEEAGRLKAKRRISAVKKNNPEAVAPKYARDESGEIIVSADGNPKPLTLDYDLINSPVGKEAAKGLKGAAREEAAANALGDKLTALHRSVEDRPDIKAGAKWYSTARTRLRKVFGNDSKLFAELLGATSARTPVETNYRFALDAYNQFKAGAFDKTLAKYREGKTKWDSQDLGDFTGETRGQFMDFWVNKHDLGVTQVSGKKYGMNSRAVLRVLDGSWAAEVQGPKTPNFAGNLTGETFEATIDVWAARLLHRLANEGKTDRWRILPENETGVTDADFYLGQAAYRNAAKQLGIKPDALQAILWFAEKDHWEQKGWTRGAGAAKSDFNVLLAETERTPEGTLQMKTPQIGLDFGASIGDVIKKKR